MNPLAKVDSIYLYREYSKNKIIELSLYKGDLTEVEVSSFINLRLIVVNTQSIKKTWWGDGSPIL